MNNPFDDNDDAFKDDRERWERERLERERLELERLEAERLERERAEAELRDGEHAEFTEDDGEYLASDTVAEPEQLRLNDEEERLPWLESDDDYAEDVVDTARIATVALLGLLAVLAIVGLAWWLGRDTSDAELLAEGSTIEAPGEPYRERPADPGGQPVAGTGDVAFAVSEGADGETQLADSSPAPAASPAPTPSATAATSPRPSIDREQGEAPALAAGSVAVQVGAYSSRATAQTGWAQLTNQHSALQGVNNRIVSAVVDGNTVYRLQAVAGSVSAAETLCRAIKAGGGDCRVVN